MSENLLQMTGICKSFSGVHALDDVNFSLKPGKVVCLAGENGCGKSTLVKIISGVYTKDEGEVYFNGKNIEKITPAEAAAMGIQVIYQDLSIFPNLSVLENLSINSELSAKGALVNWKRMKETATEALKRIEYDIPFDAKMGELSVADKQLVAIARALLFDAKLIIMDEPTTALTKKEVDALFKTVRQLRDSGIAIMFISHKLEEIFEISDEVAIMRNGKNVFSGPTAEIDRKQFTYYMTGRELTDDRFTAEILDDKPVLQVKNLSLGDKYQDVSFDLFKGEVLGITGLLGSGRTELAMSLFGLLKAKSGDIILNGEKLSITSPIQAKKNHIGYVPEDRLTEGLCLQQPIADNITISSMERLSGKMGLLNHKKIYDDADIWVEKLSIATSNSKNAAQTLSGGNQQKIVLAKWLSNDLDLLILNGPTVGVDIGAKQDIHSIIHDLAQKGLAVIIISDDLSEVVSNCSRILVMKDGRLVGEMEGQSISEDSILEIIR